MPPSSIQGFGMEKRIDKKVQKAINAFHGNLGELEQAIGMLVVGYRFGWRVLYLAHNKRTVEKAQKLLNIDFRKELPEVGDRAEKSYAWKAYQGVTNFWKAVKGEIKGIKTPEIQ